DHDAPSRRRCRVHRHRDRHDEGTGPPGPQAPRTVPPGQRRPARHADHRDVHRAVPGPVGAAELDQAGQRDPSLGDRALRQPDAGELPHRAHQHRLPRLVPQLGRGRRLHDAHRHQHVRVGRLRAEPLQLPRQARPDVGLPAHPDVPRGDPHRADLHDHGRAGAHRHQGLAGHRLLHRCRAVLRLDAPRLLRHDPARARRGGRAGRTGPLRHVLPDHPAARPTRARRHGVLHVPHRVGRGRVRHRVHAGKRPLHPGGRTAAVRASVQSSVGAPHGRRRADHRSGGGGVLLRPAPPRRRTHRWWHEGL
ncbi:MAG: Maltodextrin ABC transporter, permease protein MdxG, partial [uncultured Nocardioides sp.]